MTTPRELTEYIDRLNAVNDFDLAWHWTGNGYSRSIEVYEEEERHTLAVGTIDTIIDHIKVNLPDWGLEDVN